MFNISVSTPVVKIQGPRIARFGVELYIKREDLTDQYISGNKFRKLKYNLLEAHKNGFDRLITFGGAYSNHIHALAYAGYKYNFKTIGIIRGEETLPLNPTLEEARAFGMDLHYISRADYRNKEDQSFIDDLKSRFGAFYLVPEGGSNILAVKGCTEIVDEAIASFDHVCCASGTGGTLAGIIAGLNGRAHVWGFPALKNGGFLRHSIEKLIYAYNSQSYDNWDLILDYHFGGYAKYNSSLVTFINEFKQIHQIQLDPVYVGKLLFGIYDLISTGFFEPGQKIIAIHTGGLQGIKGFNQRFGNIIY
jgi:1-aminocyclopropane-1-carboxylate deaminase/D-cysteine desulfhydrase-like pyridoxal-dependent ACC family enzyme